MGVSPMHCVVYKSSRKADTYVYLRARDDFGVLPAAIADALGPLSFVLQFELIAERRLARADPVEVIASLQASGFHLQFPPPPDAPVERVRD